MRNQRLQNILRINLDEVNLLWHIILIGIDLSNQMSKLGRMMMPEDCSQTAFRFSEIIWSMLRFSRGLQKISADFVYPILQKNTFDIDANAGITARIDRLLGLCSK